MPIRRSDFSDPGLLTEMLFRPSLLSLIPVPDMYVTPPHWVGGEPFFIKMVEVEDLDQKPIEFRWVGD